MSRPSPSVSIRHLLAVGLALPAALAAGNHLLLTSSDSSGLGAPLLCAVMAFYVLQIGLIGWAVGTYIQPWGLRWFIFGWIMILVDLQLAAMMSNGGEGVNCLATSMLAGQLGMIIVWGILGSGHMAWRVPAWVVLLLQYWAFFALLLRLKQESPGNFSPGWDSLLTTQAIILSVLCIVLRLRGYSLLRMSEEGNASSASGAARIPIQFGIRDVLVWTTFLAVLLAMAKAGDLLTASFAKQVYTPGILLLLTIGVCTAVVLVVALWSALGRGSAALRLLVLFSLSLGIGGAIGRYCAVIARKTTAASYSNYAYWHWYSNGYWWVGWMFLTGALLAASLIIYRTLGYRLVRIARQPRQPPKRDGGRLGKN